MVEGRKEWNGNQMPEKVDLIVYIGADDLVVESSRMCCYVRVRSRGGFLIKAERGDMREGRPGGESGGEGMEAAT